MNSLKILVTGAAGQLGNELRSILEERMPGQTVYVDLPQADLTSRELAEDLLRQGGFTHVVNCAAYTAVDRAEEEKLQCKEVNEGIVSNLARIADELGTRIIHISTDYVFDGNTCRPYTESDKPEPLSVYGATKRKSETILLGLAPNSMVLRTGWLYSPHGHNFMKTVLSLAEKKDRIGIVADQTGTPTYAGDLASAIVSILESNHWVPACFTSQTKAWPHGTISPWQYSKKPECPKKRLPWRLSAQPTILAPLPAPTTLCSTRAVSKQHLA